MSAATVGITVSEVRVQRGGHTRQPFSCGGRFQCGRHQHVKNVLPQGVSSARSYLPAYEILPLFVAA